MTTVWVLIDAHPGDKEEVLRFLDTCPIVHDRRAVHFGHFEILVQVDGKNHLEAQSFIAGKLRFHKGIVAVREIEDEELPSVLASAGA